MRAGASNVYYWLLPKTKALRSSAGFSLIEMLVVLTIIGLIVGLVGPKVLNYLSTSKSKAAQLQIRNFRNALDLFLIDVGRYPTTAEDLTALVQKPSAVTHWTGPYLESGSIPADPWGNPYRYRSPGEHGPYDIVSFGADGREGGTGENSDIASW